MINLDNFLEASDEQRYMTDEQVKANKKKRQNAQTVGMELEMECDYDYPPDANNVLKEMGIDEFVAVEDGSVEDGLEFKTSRPVKYNELNRIYKIIDRINNSSSLNTGYNSSCGVHIHMGLSPNVQYTVLDFYRLMLNTYEKQSEIANVAMRDPLYFARSLRPLVMELEHALERMKSQYERVPRIDTSDVDKLKEMFNDPANHKAVDMIFAIGEQIGKGRLPELTEEKFGKMLIQFGFASVFRPRNTDNTNKLEILKEFADRLEKVIDKMEIDGEEFEEIEMYTDILDALNAFINIVPNSDSESMNKALTAIKNSITKTFNSELVNAWDKVTTQISTDAGGDSATDDSELNNIKSEMKEINDAIDRGEFSGISGLIAQFSRFEKLNKYGLALNIKNAKRRMVKAMYKDIKAIKVRQPLKHQYELIHGDWFTDETSDHYDTRRYWGVNMHNIGTTREALYGGYEEKYNTIEFRWGSGKLALDTVALKMYIDFLNDLQMESFTGDRILTYNGYTLVDVSNTTEKNFIKTLSNDKKRSQDADHVIAVYDADQTTLYGYILVDQLYKDLHKPRSEKQLDSRGQRIATTRHEYNKILTQKDEKTKDEWIEEFKKERLKIRTDKQAFKDYAKKILSNAKALDGGIKGRRYNKVLSEIKGGKVSDVLTKLDQEFETLLEQQRRKVKFGQYYNAKSLVGKVITHEDWPDGFNLLVEDAIINEDMMIFGAGNASIPFKYGISNDDKLLWEILPDDSSHQKFVESLDSYAYIIGFNDACKFDIYMDGVVLDEKLICANRRWLVFNQSTMGANYLNDTTGIVTFADTGGLSGATMLLFDGKYKSATGKLVASETIPATGLLYSIDSLESGEKSGNVKLTYATERRGVEYRLSTKFVSDTIDPRELERVATTVEGWYYMDSSESPRKILDVKDTDFILSDGETIDIETALKSENLSKTEERTISHDDAISRTKPGTVLGYTDYIIIVIGLTRPPGEFKVIATTNNMYFENLGMNLLKNNGYNESGMSYSTQGSFAFLTGYTERYSKYKSLSKFIGERVVELVLTDTGGNKKVSDGDILDIDGDTLIISDTITNSTKHIPWGNGIEWDDGRILFFPDKIRKVD